MQLINGKLSLNAILLFLFSPSGSVIVITPLPTMYPSLKSHKSALKIGALISIYPGIFF